MYKHFCWQSLQFHSISSMTARFSTSLLLKRFVVVLLLLFFFCSCSSKRSYHNRYFPVKNLEKRESSLGFHIRPPVGPNWFEKVNNKSLYYLKKTNYRQYTIYTKATEIHLDNPRMDAAQFLSYVKRQKGTISNNSNFKNVSVRYTQNTSLSPLCVRYLQHYDDYSSAGSRNSGYVKVKNKGMVCMHPQHPKNGVDMYYQESYRQTIEGVKNSFKDEAETFLSSLTFTSAKG